MKNFEFKKNLEEKTLAFAASVIKFYQYMKKTKNSRHIFNTIAKIGHFNW